jgi:hypothetical protein
VRVTAVGQCFFDSLPAGADFHLLQSVLDDWLDREATAILRRCAETARPVGHLAVLGRVSPDEGRGPSLALLMLVGGRDRCLVEFCADPRGRVGTGVHRSATIRPLHHRVPHDIVTHTRPTYPAPP